MLVALIPLPAFGSPIFSIPMAASSFGFLGYTISNTGLSTVVGNVGAVTTITGFPPGIASGFSCTPTSGAPCTSGDDSSVLPAYNALYNPGGAFDTAEALTSSGAFTTDTSQTFLGNTVYASSGDISTITGTNLTFDAGGDASEVFVIKIDGALTVNGAMTFTLLGNAQADNIFWIVDGTATISPGSSGPITFDGNILAGDGLTPGAFTMSAGSGALAGTINGCVYTETTGTFAAETILTGCSATGIAPEPGSSLLVALGCLTGVFGLRRFQKSKA
jgi:hypothetical protein